MPLPAAAAQVTLAWDQNSEPDIIGYKLYYGTSSRAYDRILDVGNTTTYTILGLNDGTTYYFAVTAYDSSGSESSFSGEVIHATTAPNRQPNIPAIPSGPSSGLLNTGYIFTASASDPDGDVLDYRFDWGDGVISSWGAASQSHSWSSTGAYCVRAQARDSNDASSGWSACRDINIAAAVTNHPPEANAGSDQTVVEGDTVTLSGAGSFDPDDNIASYSWNQTNGPSARITNAGLTDVSFTAPDVDTDGVALRFQLTVRDNNGFQDVDSCVVYVNNTEVEDSGDSDNDGVPDDQDAFPSDPTETTDTDSDGIGNNADPDDDNDQMPDAWEIQYGLDPLVDDAAEDADLDGISNLDEFLSDSDPIVPRGNAAPDSPVLISPLDQTPVTLTPTLQTDEFYDPDSGDFHSETQWQITRETDNVRVLDVTSPNSLNSLQVPKAILKKNTRYSWRAKFYDSHGAPSDWSASAVFVAGNNPEDLDGNGVPDDQEIDLTSDMNEDGILDVDQDTIKCVNAKNKKSQIGLSFEGSDTVMAIEYLAYQDPKSLNSASGKPNNLPFGLIDFRLRVARSGDEAVVTIYFSSKVPKDGKWYKYDPIERVWADYSAYTELGANKKSITLRLQDGGPGDGDGIANGIIVDPSGLSVDSIGSSMSIGESGAGNAGCFISATTRGSSIHPEIAFLHQLPGAALAIMLLVLILIAGGRLVFRFYFSP